MGLTVVGLLYIAVKHFTKKPCLSCSELKNINDKLSGIQTSIEENNKTLQIMMIEGLSDEQKSEMLHLIKR